MLQSECAPNVFLTAIKCCSTSSDDIYSVISVIFSALVSVVALILVPRAHDPSGLWQGSRALAGPDFLSMRRAFVSCSRPIRFDEKSVNRGLPVLDQARALEPCHRPEGSWALGTRML